MGYMGYMGYMRTKSLRGLRQSSRKALHRANMKPTDQTLQRLLQAAAKAAPEAVDAPPLGLETRVLANWRAAGMDDDSVSVFAFFRRAVLSAGLVLMLSAAWSLTQSGGNLTGDEAAQLDYNIQMSLNP
jgi:hypothetical protein